MGILKQASTIWKWYIKPFYKKGSLRDFFSRRSSKAALTYLSAIEVERKFKTDDLLLATERPEEGNKPDVLTNLS